MSELSFIPGYYEWHLCNGDELLHTWGDFLEDLNCDENGKSTEEDCCDMADFLMFGWKEEVEDNNDLETLNLLDDSNFFIAATETIANELIRRYGK